MTNNSMRAVLCNFNNPPRMLAGQPCAALTHAEHHALASGLVPACSQVDVYLQIHVLHSSPSAWTQSSYSICASTHGWLRHRHHMTPPGPVTFRFYKTRW